MNGKSSIIITQNKRYKNETSLSSYAWKIKKETRQILAFAWSVVRIVPAYSNTTKKCALCLHEKLEILMYHDLEEYLLSNYDSKD